MKKKNKKKKKKKNKNKRKIIEIKLFYVCYTYYLLKYCYYYFKI